MESTSYAPSTEATFPGQLGEGVTDVDEVFADSFGRVFEALDARLDPERPARRRIRLLEFDLPDPEIDWRRQWKERARVLAEQHWPFLCTVRDWGQTRDGTIFYFTDAVGGLLADRISSHKGVDSQTAETTVEHLLIALESLHRRRLAHGDVRPERVLLVGEGERVEALLAEPEIGPLTWWSQGLVRENLAARYYPPEWKSQAAEPNPQADLYALGLTACEMALGSDAVSNEGEIAGERRRRLLRRLKQANAGRAYRQFVRLLLAESPSRRPAHAGAALHEWRRLQENARWRQVRSLCVVLALLSAFLLILAAWGRGDLTSRLAHADGRANELQAALTAERMKTAPELERLTNSIESLHGKMEALQPATSEPRPIPPPTAEELAKAEWQKAIEQARGRPRETLKAVEARLAQRRDVVSADARRLLGAWYRQSEGQLLELDGLGATEFQGEFGRLYRSCFERPWEADGRERLRATVATAVQEWIKWVGSTQTWNEIGLR